MKKGQKSHDMTDRVASSAASVRHGRLTWRAEDEHPAMLSPYLIDDACELLIAAAHVQVIAQHHFAEPEHGRPAGCVLEMQPVSSTGILAINLLDLDGRV
ncbi:MAG: hypothetical protein Q7T57_04910 [Dehalococcoidales bacterium]|nr:hypothetical protein [Dehalococcoidales bacterium]